MSGPPVITNQASVRGWVREWHQLERRRLASDAQLERYSRQLAKIHADEAASRYLGDRWNMAMIARDYHQGIHLLQQGRLADLQQLGEVHDLYTYALGVVEIDVEFCEGLVAGAWALYLPLLALAMLQRQAKRLHQRTLALRRELARARKLTRQADGQLVLNTLLTAIGLALPEISLLAQGALFLGQVVSDQLLGPQTAVQHAGASTAVQGVSAFSDATDKVEHLRALPGARILRGRAFGAGTAFLGFQGDLNEALASYRYKDRVEQALADTEKAYDSLLTTIRREKPRLRMLKIRVRRWVTSLGTSLGDAANVRKLLEKEMKHLGYPRIVPLRWPRRP